MNLAALLMGLGLLANGLQESAHIVTLRTKVDTGTFSFTGFASDSDTQFVGLLTELPITFLEIEMPCGQTWDLLPGMTIPTNDVPCTCGNTNHWFIRFRKGLKTTNP